MNRRTAVLSASVLALALGLAACNKSSQTNTAALTAPPLADASAPPALPLTAGAPAGGLAYAPSIDSLPAVPPPPLVRVSSPIDEYAYLDQAYYADDAFADAPPDYAFGYDGYDSWAWRGYDGSYEIVEPVRDGWRHYYYRPDSYYPYLVSDPDYAYGYDGSSLVVIYDSRGRIVPYDRARADYAGRFLSHAEALYRASQNRDRRAVNAAEWAAQRDRVDAQRTEWAAARTRQTAWASYDAAHRAQQVNYWNREREQRQQSAQRFTQWRQANFKGPAPAPVHDTRQQVRALEAQNTPPVAAPAPNARPGLFGLGGRENPAARQAQNQPRIDRRQQAEQARQSEQQQRQAQAGQQRQQAEQARQGQQQQRQAQANQQREQAQQARQNEQQQRQAQVDQRRQADTAQQQRQAQANQQRQQAEQARVNDQQRQAQAGQQRQQAEQARQNQQAQRQAQANQQREQAQQARQNQLQQRQAQAEQQRAQQAQRAEAANAHAQPAAARAPEQPKHEAPPKQGGRNGKKDDKK